MITFKELLSGHNVSDISIKEQHNLEELLTKINLIRKAYNKPMIVTSGYRSLQDHLRIYSQKGIHPPKVPMNSNHLIGKAVDISDPNGELMTWCILNEGMLQSVGLWCEADTKGWTHFQTVSPKSGKRFFKP